MDSDINNIEAAESERLLSGNVVQPIIYGSKEPSAQTPMMADTTNSVPSSTFTQYVAALAATGGALAAGATLGWSSPIESRLTNVTMDEAEYKFEISESNFAWIGSLVTLGAAFVCLFIGPILQLVGRKLTMLVLVIPFTIGWILVTFASNVIMLLFGRFLLGISGGAFCVAAPTYTGEIAQASIRGSLGSYFQLMLVTGVLLAYVIGSITTIFALNLICAAIPLIFGAIFMFMPETPTYYISKGNKAAAEKSLKWLRGAHYDCSQELADLQEQHEEERKNKISLIQALNRRATQKAIFISLGLMFFQQMSGINAVIFFTKSIFDAAKSADSGGIDSSVATIIVGVMQVISVFVSSIIVDRLGRRLLLIPSSIFMIICTALLGVYFFMKENDKDSVASLGWLPVSAVCGFIILFSVGFGPIPWMMMGELFSNDIKGVAGSAAGAFNWILAFVVTSQFKNLKTAIKDGPTFWVFTLFCVLGLAFVVFFVPETKGKSLPEIQRILAGENVKDTENGKRTAVNDSKF